jgi:histidinol-phosphate/aromatic aminotransferase/cobyric acid decarboxylase-like protein
MARLEEPARAAHGGLPLDELAQLGIDPRSVLDLSTSLSPLPAHPAVLDAVRSSDVHGYPDPRCGEAKAAIARATLADPSSLVIGHGSVELLWSLVRVLAESDEPGKHLLTVAPTFSEPEAAARAYGIALARVDMPEQTGFALDAQRIADAIAWHVPFAVYLCQPNNPTGASLPGSILRDLIASHPRVPFIVDEAFLSLSARHADIELSLPPNAIRVRSLTKDHGLAGLRVGYAVCAPALVELIEAQRPPWMISAPAQAAIVAAMSQPDHVARIRRQLFDHKAALIAELHALGIESVPSDTTFFLARVHGADALRDFLLHEHGVLIRSGSTFGLPNHIRLPACLPDARARLMHALGAAMERP